MQNEDNLVPLFGRGKQKKKNKKKQQQPAFFPKQSKTHPHIYIMTPKKPHQVQNRTLAQPQTGQTYQAPHHQQESMVDLTDDTSPDTPLANNTGGWKPVGNSPVASSSNSAPTEVKLTKYEKFIASLNKPSRAKQRNNRKRMKQDAETKQSSEIKWELNEIDDKDTTSNTVVPVETIPTLQPNPQIIQGTASELKLSQANDRTVITVVPKQDDVSSQAPSQSSSSANIQIQTKSLPNRPSRSALQHNRLSEASLDQLYQTYSYPKGIPRSFLKQQNIIGAIQPQDQNPDSGQARNTIVSEPIDPGLQVLTNNPTDSPIEEQQYSPSDVYDDGTRIEEGVEGADSPDGQGGQKRLSAFRRLGPAPNPKKPKLTINLCFNKDQSVREVLDNTEGEDKYTPAHLRKDVLESKNDIVVKYLPHWPWKRTWSPRKAVTARTSKSVMILEQEQMEEAYEKENTFIQVSVRGYPRTWNKEHVLDAIIDAVKGKSFIPCFTQFTQEECKFLVIRSRSALVTIHKLGFYIRKDDVELGVTLSLIDMTLKHIDFIPRLVLRKLLSMEYDGERKLSLKEFSTKSDISHFIYFPLNRVSNQTELVQLQSTVAWDFLTDLDLSHNRITSIDGFDLSKTTPKLKHLDLSYNSLERVTSLLPHRELSLKSLRLEGNPLCQDYIDPTHYVKAIRMIFGGLNEIDGVPLHLKGELPKFKRNYCPSDEASLVANKFLETFFPLLETPYEERTRMEELYHERAVLTVTYTYNLRYSSLARKFRNILMRARVLEEGTEEGVGGVEGAATIARLLTKWPALRHDPYTFTLDCLLHTDNYTILRIDGILKLTSETLAEDEYLLAFSRTVVLTTLDGVEYKILNEMILWDEPSKELANVAFQINTLPTTRLSLKFDSAPDEELKNELTDIFVKITDLDRKTSARCLELKEWNLRGAIEYFMKLLKLDDLNSLRRELEMDSNKL